MARPLEERFEEKVCSIGNDSCWEWTASRTTGGYGNIRIEGKNLYAHRLSWEIHKGPIPNGMHVLHTCDNRGCVNPAHLFLGTNLDNIKDCTAKGRGVGKGRGAKGEKNGASKLRERDVIKIRALSKTVRKREIAEIYKVSETYIYSIVRRDVWKHI